MSLSPNRFCLVVMCVILGSNSSSADVITQWTFETSRPAQSGSSTISGIVAEIGTGTASGFHTQSLTNWTSPAGNGSAGSFAANRWSVNDYFQFSMATTGFSGINVSWAQTSSATGPKDFKLSYSVNSGAFIDLSTYTVQGTFGPYTADFAAFPALNSAASVDFRLSAISTVAVNGGTVGTTGTSRVDDFSVKGTAITGSAVPEPACVSLLAALVFSGWLTAQGRLKASTPGA